MSGMLILIMAVALLQCSFADKFDVLHPMEANAKVTNTVFCQTTAGPLTIEVIRDWAPIGADQWIDMVKSGFYHDVPFFRSVSNFLTQFGAFNLKDYPERSKFTSTIKDDPNHNIPFRKGYLSFAGGGANTRNAQTFFTYGDQDFLGKEPWETPFGRIKQTSENTRTMDNIYKGYGDIPPFGNGPDQQEIFKYGNAYLRSKFPLVSYITSCNLLIDEITFNGEDHHRELTEIPNTNEDAAAAADLEAGTAKTSLGMEHDHVHHREVLKHIHDKTARMAKAVDTIKDKFEEHLHSNSGFGFKDLTKHIKKKLIHHFSLEKIMAIKQDEDHRREIGEEVIEELTPAELKKYYKEIKNHHGPVEVPPGEIMILLIFSGCVYFIWQYSKKKDFRDQKKQ
jgi:peptidyl-prolyl cis-trans isomerase A (cyclophilin A)